MVWKFKPLSILVLFLFPKSSSSTQYRHKLTATSCLLYNLMAESAQKTQFKTFFLEMVKIKKVENNHSIAYWHWI